MFPSYTINNSFKDAGMFPFSYKVALKQMLHDNARRDLKRGTDSRVSGDHAPKVMAIEKQP